jgi:DNA topoisomerase-3
MAKTPLTVILTEKPSVARDVAAFLAGLQGGKYQNGNGSYVLPNGDEVTYTVGHIIEMEMPDAYLTKEQNSADAMTYLPLKIDEYKYHPRYKRNQDGTIAMREDKPIIDPHFRILEKLVKKADIIINAGDVGREGQLIMDELFVYLGIDPNSPKIKRMHVVDNTPDGLRSAWQNLELNSLPKWRNTGIAGLCRSESDWDIGMNASRAYQSLLGDRRIALGRVKTPVLNIVSERCKEIETFKPVDYFVPIVTMTDGLQLRWKARKGAEGSPGFDLQGRIISKQVADAIVAQINAGAQGLVTKAESDLKKVKPPLPFSLVKLQAEASKRLGISVEEVTKAAQSLYEKHKLITYVGTECEYLPETMLAEARSIMEGLSPMFNRLMTGANSQMHPKSYSDKKMEGEEHHAIIPKGVLPKGQLSMEERGVFDIITRRFAAQFYPDYVYNAFSVGIDFSADQFTADAQEMVQPGWKDAEADSESGDADGESLSGAGTTKDAENETSTERISR